MKRYIFLLAVGLILLLATQTEYCLSNITGLAMMYVCLLYTSDAADE